MAGELDKFGWIKLNVEVMSRRYLHVDTQVGEAMIVLIVKTLVFDVETLEVRILDGGLVSLNYLNIIYNWPIVTIVKTNYRTRLPQKQAIVTDYTRTD